MKIVYAPTWMKDAISAAGKFPNTVLDLGAMLDIFTVNDVAHFVAENRQLSKFINPAIVESFSPVDFDVAGLHHPKRQQLADALSKIGYSAKHAIPPEAKDKSMRLTCDLLDPNTIIFRHIVKQDEKLPEEIDESKVMERCMRQMSTELTFQQLAALPIMGRWLSYRRKYLMPTAIAA